MSSSHSSRPFRNCLTINNNKYKDGGFKLKLKVFRLLKTCKCIYFFKYSQLKMFMSSRSTDIMHIPKLSLIEEIIGKRGERGHLSNYYNLIMCNSKESAVDKLNTWRKD